MTTVAERFAHLFSKINWGSSTLDAEAIDIMNTLPSDVTSVEYAKSILNKAGYIGLDSLWTIHDITSHKKGKNFTAEELTLAKENFSKNYDVDTEGFEVWLDQFCDTLSAMKRQSVKVQARGVGKSNELFEEFLKTLNEEGKALLIASIFPKYMVSRLKDLKMDFEVETKYNNDGKTIFGYLFKINIKNEGE